MTDITIQIENISKLYHIGQAQRRHDSLREALAATLSAPLQRLSRTGRENGIHSDDSFWALKDISFDVHQGEVVGIIGKNGAGKSTLLKILSRITEPTIGRARILGRVGSLLEVGTGFHPELTGRENIYLNGAILGMRRAEIDRKFDEIVTFAEINRFLDTPVKRYSSGMYVRLAFAVAAHLDPEILLVDEVLAVGDAEFQKKCLGKIGDVASKGRTVLYVSHNMSSIQSLCNRIILLSGGMKIFDGPTAAGLDKYLSIVEQISKQQIGSREDRLRGEQFRFLSVEFLDPHTLSPYSNLITGQSVLIRVGYENTGGEVIKGTDIGIGFRTLVGTYLFACRSAAVGATIDIPPGKGSTECLLPKLPLKEGTYTLSLAARKGNEGLDQLRDATSVQVVGGDYYGWGILPGSGEQGVLVEYAWKSDH
ncbi:MAG: ABC transporter ATP-binding protein [Chloroflexi bacterium]|nr:ABC transporter ATP-binding protein [Chloroflexota bacterium]